jgi:branched-chain amino acid transport system substrate-binding protein
MMVIRTACILAALAASAADHARADIPIGFNSALTGSYGWMGEPHLAGTELAIADLNAKGGVLGEPLQLLVADDGCNGELAPLVAEKFVSEAVAVASARPARALRFPHPRSTGAPAS